MDHRRFTTNFPRSTERSPWTNSIKPSRCSKPRTRGLKTNSKQSVPPLLSCKRIHRKVIFGGCLQPPAVPNYRNENERNASVPTRRISTPAIMFKPTPRITHSSQFLRSVISSLPWRIPQLTGAFCYRQGVGRRDYVRLRMSLACIKKEGRSARRTTTTPQRSRYSGHYPRAEREGSINLCASVAYYSVMIYPFSTPSHRCLLGSIFKLRKTLSPLLNF